ADTGAASEPGREQDLVAAAASGEGAAPPAGRHDVEPGVEGFQESGPVHRGAARVAEFEDSVRAAQARNDRQGSRQPRYGHSGTEAPCRRAGTSQARAATG